MKSIFFSAFILLTTCTFAQSSQFNSVEQTLNNYLHGSSYNELVQLESAFADNATLYLTARGEFRIFTPKEYVSFFKGTKGEFNGRQGKILSIEVFHDIATAKAEIENPEQGWYYMDLFLLKKFEDGWKIISKTATRKPEINE